MLEKKILKKSQFREAWWLEEMQHVTSTVMFNQSWTGHILAVYSVLNLSRLAKT